MRHDIVQALSVLLLAAVVLMAQNVEARPPRAREAHAVVVTLNHDQRTLSVSYAKGRGPHELIWNSATEFLRDWKFVTAAELKEGTHVVIYYHSPFFGKPFLTKVVWTNGEPTKTSTTAN